MVSLALVVLVFAVLFPALADYGEVWRVVTAIPGRWLLAVAAAGVLNQASYPFLYTVTIPGLRYRHSLAARLASTTAANVIPGGGAVGVGLTYVMLSSWGHSGSSIANAVMLTGIWNNLMKLLLPLVALALVSLGGEPIPALVEAAMVGAAVLAGAVLLVIVLLRTPLRRHLLGLVRGTVALGARLARRGDRVDAEAVAARFAASFREALSASWARLGMATIATFLTQYLVLLTALRAVGVGSGILPWTQVLAGYAVVRLISAIPITPGGLGVAELGVTAFLGSGQPEVVVAQIAAGVLLFRSIDYALEIPVGAGALAAWRIGLRRRLRRAAGPGREADPAFQDRADDAKMIG
jgi:uncharacterized membrane protein YbhN (UPF0104 family)